MIVSKVTAYRDVFWPFAGVFELRNHLQKCKFEKSKESRHSGVNKIPQKDANIATPLNFSSSYFFLFASSFQTSLLCIVWELAEGGSLVNVGCWR